MQTTTENIKFLIDDDIFLFDNTELSIYQACLVNGIYLPRFCYHNKLKIAGNCRICLVEDPKSLKPIISCAVLINNDQSIFTKTTLIKQAQEGIIEYLLINHPLDCPICDQGGECDLQDQTMIYGSDKGRYYELYKRSVENVNYGPLIKFTLTRCIHCARCTRFLTDIGGYNFLSFINRGQYSQISSYIEGFLTSEISGNIIDLCPVGALTSKPYAFTARIWEMTYIKYIDVIDNFNSTIRVDVRGLNVIRVLPYINENLNEEWITDLIRFFYDSIITQRLLYPIFLYKKKKIYMGWLKTLKTLKLFFFNTLSFYISKKIKYNLTALSFKDIIDLESLFSLKFFFNKLSFLYLNIADKTKNINLRSDYIKINTFEDMLHYQNLVIVNLNLRYESPILNIKIINMLDTYENIKIFTTGYISNFNYNLKHLGNSCLFFSKKIFEDTTTLFILQYSTNQSLLTNFYSNYVLLHDSHVKVSSYELGFINKLKNKFSNIFTNFSFLYYINNDSVINYFSFFSKFNLNVYQGQHGDLTSKHSNVILPSKMFFEKSAYYINTFGLIQNLKSFYFDNGFKKTKTDAEIIKILSALFLLSFHIKNSLTICTNESFISLVKNSFAYLAFPVYFHIFNKPIKSIINNFYNTISITRMSRTLNICSKLYTVKNDFNFIMYRNIV